MKVQNKKTGKIEFINPSDWEKIKDMGDQSRFRVLDAKATLKESILDIEVKPIDLKEEVRPFDDETIKPKRTRKSKKQ